MIADTERDACGVGFVADLHGRRSHEILTHALVAVRNLSHRGAIAADGKTGDGAGVVTQLPHALLRRDLAIPLPDDDIAVAMTFLPQPPADRERSLVLVEGQIRAGGLRVIGWRDVPVDPEALGAHARATRPHIAQVVVARPAGLGDGAFDRALYLCRKRIERAASGAHLSLYVPSFSRRTIVYKGLFASPQLPRFYHDLVDSSFVTALAVFHQRYSTNTFPSWHLAQPFRMLAHNGEINTLQGNMHWTQAREQALGSGGWGESIADLLPVLQAGGSDSAMLDNVVELLVTSGRDLAHALRMVVPAAWEAHGELDDAMRAFYEYHALLTEPWDGPAALAFSDGVMAGAVLDRNGFRPARYLRTGDGLVVMASEAGVLPVPPEQVVEKGRLGPGQMVLVDTARGVFLSDEEIKAACARRQPYRTWLRATVAPLGAMPSNADGEAGSVLIEQQKLFGYTLEDVERFLRPMVQDGKDPVFSMGDDIPPAVLSDRARPFYHYFKQRFAQVTNPPIDPLRERLVMSLSTYLGPKPALLDQTAPRRPVIHLPTPFLLPDELQWVRSRGPLPVHRIPALVAPSEGAEGFVSTLERVIEAACRAAEEPGIVVLTDRGADAQHAPLPMLLVVAGVHHELIRAGLRMRVGLVAETGEARDIHQLACLIGYGANAVCPYLALGTVAADRTLPGDARDRWAAYRRAADAGLLKIMSKMGISTLSGYCGAQIFEAVGLDEQLVAQYFPGTPSRLGGIGLPEIAADALSRHCDAFASPPVLAEAGYVRFRRDGEYHAFNPYMVKALHRAARNGDAAAHRQFAEMAASRPPTAVRDLLEFAPNNPVPVEDVEPAKEIVRRFVISAMSHGALSREAHEALAIAANRLGARSNSGEGGEDPARYHRESNSRIKQVASARFGVTPEYLLSADELEIKMAQGSKPGEGGQLPGHKVSEEIARIRRAQAGSTLISPPPHHDIYSIEDLAQLIYDLKRINPRARVAVKLVSESGVGTIAAGVAKAFADTIQISGHDGGTGASPLDSIKHAGVPWELGLAETQQILVQNDLRGRVRLRVDGGLKTGRDIVIAALLGADEFGFGSAAVVALGCVMARQCHLNTCPVGIATQREDLRLRFSGRPEMVIAYLLAVAEQVREILASLGARRLQDLIGRVDLLRRRSTSHVRANRLRLDFVLQETDQSALRPRRNVQPRNDRIEDPPIDAHILADIAGALDDGRAVQRTYAIHNGCRTVGAGVAGEIVARSAERGLPSVTLRFAGTAGQSFGAFCIDGLTLMLEGEANDYVGKGMAGGEIVVRPPQSAAWPRRHNVIMGNTVLYGATGGRLFVAGGAGERFAVRNSGATAVVEGIGDHGCEYMTGGAVVVLGTVGRNFAAGMTGGVAFVLDEDGVLPLRCNVEHVEYRRLADGDDTLGVTDLIAAHLGLTGSPWAREILDHWDRYERSFWRVAPKQVSPTKIPEVVQAGR